MSIVYVVQNQHRWDREANDFVPKFDLAPAAEFGRLEYLLPPPTGPFRPDSVIAELREKLQNFTDDDYLLLIGNPVLIGLATALAAAYNGGSVSLLQWSGKDQRYIPVDASGLERTAYGREGESEIEIVERYRARNTRKKP